MKRIGIIGCGVIGRFLVDKISEDESLEVAFVFDADPERTADLPALRISSIDEFASRQPDLVVECAARQAVRDYAPIILTETDMLIMSVTALAEDSLVQTLEGICLENRTRYHISHGAILGIDGIRAGAAILDSVTITTTKSPKNFDRRDIERAVIYDGPTRQLCDIYPRSVNVHAILAMAGIGLDRTHSKLIVDPDTDYNAHLIEAKSEGTEFTIQIRSRRAGKVTGLYTLESVYRTIQRICTARYGLNVA